MKESSSREFQPTWAEALQLIGKRFGCELITHTCYGSKLFQPVRTHYMVTERVCDARGQSA